MPVHVRTLASVLVVLGAAAAAGAQGRDILPPVPTPTDIKPGSITCDECPYPAPSKYLDISVYSQDVRISYMDIAPTGAANGHVVLLLHGNGRAGAAATPPRGMKASQTRMSIMLVAACGGVGR